MNPWIPWAGGAMPVPYRTLVQVRHRDGDEFECEAGTGYCVEWNHWSGCDMAEIVAWRLAEPKPEARPWTPWPGADNPPFPEGTPIEVRHRDGVEHTTSVGGGAAVRWDHRRSPHDIVAYRLIRPESDDIFDQI